MAQAISLDNKFDVRVSTFGTSSGILVHAEKPNTKSLSRRHWMEPRTCERRVAGGHMQNFMAKKIKKFGSKLVTLAEFYYIFYKILLKQTKKMEEITNWT